MSARPQESSKHLARLWAFDEILRLAAANKREEAIRLAAQYQLVTPVSGAVVLETKEQFDRADLKPVSKETVPTVPEPSIIALLIAGIGMMLFLKRRSARAESALA